MSKALWITVCLLALGATRAPAEMIDLNDFVPSPTVTVAVDGLSALMTEEADPNDFVFLSNDPGLGDANVIIPGPFVSLVFEYVFDEPAGNDDEFVAFVIDADGNSLEGELEFVTTSSSSGTVSFPLSSPSLFGETLGLEFQLNPLGNDAATTSTVTVSNLRLLVPEPGSLLLAVLGLCSAAACGWRRRTAQRRRG